ncbi:hypothetical protein [Actinoplanes friuliensis]|nr:hypothetical protein [Actinoplanes friuliensis]
MQAIDVLGLDDPDNARTRLHLESTILQSATPSQDRARMVLRLATEVLATAEPTTLQMILDAAVREMAQRTGEN